MVNVLIAVDGDKLAQQVSDGSLGAGTQSNPTMLGAYSSSDVYISMMAQQSFATNDQGGSELTITVNSGDSIRWSMTTFGGNNDYTAYVYDGRFNDKSTGQPSTAITSPLNYIPITNVLYLPSTSNAEGVATKYTNHQYVAQGTVVTPDSQIQYYLSFALINNANGNVVGYFLWDPFINVNG